MSNTSESPSTRIVPAAAGATLNRGKLLQVLGVWFGISAAIGNSIGAGIVRTPGDIAQILPRAWLFIGVWIIGGLYALFGASSLAELGAAIPRSGGQYNFSRRAIGEYAGFIVGWSDWLSTCGTAAAVGIVIAEYSGDLFSDFRGTREIDRRCDHSWLWNFAVARNPLGQRRANSYCRDENRRVFDSARRLFCCLADMLGQPRL